MSHWFPKGTIGVRAKLLSGFPYALQSPSKRRCFGRPFRLQGNPKEQPRDTQDSPGTVLESTWSQFGAETVSRTHVHRFGFVVLLVYFDKLTIMGVFCCIILALFFRFFRKALGRPWPTFGQFGMSLRVEAALQSQYQCSTIKTP